MVMFPGIDWSVMLQCPGKLILGYRNGRDSFLAGDLAVLGVFLNTEQAGCCGAAGTVPPQVNKPLATALAYAPEREDSPQTNVVVDLSAALPPHRGSGALRALHWYGVR